MRKLLSNFIGNEDGLEMVEWAVVAAVITAAAGAAMASVGTSVGGALTALSVIISAL